MDAIATATPLPKRVKNLTGLVFGLLTVFRYAGRAENSRHALWWVRCSCPKKTEKKIEGYVLVRGHAMSCGCIKSWLAKEQMTTHAMSKTPEYQAWLSARKRTRDPRCSSYKRYGGRTPPITMSDELYDSFDLWFAELGFRPSKDHSVDRKENFRGYERGNLKWSTAQEQALNRGNNRYLEVNGVRKTHSQWDDDYGFRRGTVKNRVNMGWPVEKIFSTPIRPLKRKTHPELTGRVD